MLWCLGWRGYVCAGWGGHFEDEGEAGESFFKEDRESRKGIDREVFSERGGGGWGSPVQWVVDR